MEMVSLAPDRTARVARPCLPYLDSIVINELEAGALAGIEAPIPTADGPVDGPALEAMALSLVEQRVSVLAVVHFPVGCVASARPACAARTPPKASSPRNNASPKLISRATARSPRSTM